LNKIHKIWKFNIAKSVFTNLHKYNQLINCAQNKQINFIISIIFFSQHEVASFDSPYFTDTTGLVTAWANEHRAIRQEGKGSRKISNVIPIIFKYSQCLTPKAHQRGKIMARTTLLEVELKTFF